MNSDFDYAPTNQQQVAVFVGVVLLHGVLNTLDTAWLARITSVRPHISSPSSWSLPLPS
jgi:hypothetical protein